MFSTRESEHTTVIESVIENVSKTISYIRDGEAVSHLEKDFQKSLIRLSESLMSPSDRTMPQLASAATGWRAELLVQVLLSRKEGFLQFLDTKLSSNQGFDLATVYGASLQNPSRIVITEIKSALQRKLKQPISRELRCFKDGSHQMDALRITMTMNNMLSDAKAGSSVHATASVLSCHWDKVQLEMYGFEQSSDKLYHMSLQHEKPNRLILDVQPVQLKHRSE